MHSSFYEKHHRQNCHARIYAHKSSPGPPEGTLREGQEVVLQEPDE